MWMNVLFFVEVYFSNLILAALTQVVGKVVVDV